MSSIIPRASKGFPLVRMRRNRQAKWVRNLVRENTIRPSDLVLPLFVIEGQQCHEPISKLPGVARLTIDLAVAATKQAMALGVQAVALFPAVNPSLKTDDGAEATNPDSLICRAVQTIKSDVPDVGVICDVALDPYTTHGHDGLLQDGIVRNDDTIEVLAQQALTLAAAGCDVVAPSDMMDGRVGAIRAALDDQGYVDTLILSYAAKYASVFYGPFRDAVGSAKALGGADKSTYQMDPANVREALREVQLDIEEGADMVMIKPGLPYLDVISSVAQFSQVPVMAYQVSGEYAMLSLGAEQGLFNRTEALHESLISFKRAGATGIITYAALEISADLQGA